MPIHRINSDGLPFSLSACETPEGSSSLAVILSATCHGRTGRQPNSKIRQLVLCLSVSYMGHPTVTGRIGSFRASDMRNPISHPKMYLRRRSLAKSGHCFDAPVRKPKKNARSQVPGLTGSLFSHSMNSKPVGNVLLPPPKKKGCDPCCGMTHVTCT